VPHLRILVTLVEHHFGGFEVLRGGRADRALAVDLGLRVVLAQANRRPETALSLSKSKPAALTVSRLRPAP
jgi:hypothetical protein